MSRSFFLSALLFALACGDTAAPVSRLPAVPAVPIATPRTGEIVVSWQDLSDNETGFRVEVRTSDGPWLLLAQTTANKTNVTHPNVLHQVQYFYRIAACNDAGCSEFVETSAKWQTGAPPVITSVTIPTLNGDNATFRASVRTGGSDTHVLFTYRKVGAQFSVSIGPVTVPAGPSGADVETDIRFVNATAYGLEPESDYTVSVSAYNIVGSTLTGEPIAFRTRPIEPVMYQNFRVELSFPNIVRLVVVVDQAGLGVEAIGEITLAGSEFDQPIATRTATYPDRLGVHIMGVTFSGLESGKDYKARLILRNANGTVITPVRSFRAP